MSFTRQIENGVDHNLTALDKKLKTIATDVVAIRTLLQEQQHAAVLLALQKSVSLIGASSATGRNGTSRK